MIVNFYNKKDLNENQQNQIRTLWEKTFEKTEKDDIGIINETIVGLFKNENNFVGMVFLLSPTIENLSSDINHFKNIKEQGVSENDCYIYNFCIKEGERKKGLGKFLLSECHEHIKSLGKNNVMLFVEDGNIPAVCMYNKSGYNVYRAGLSGFVMKKNLH